MRFHAVVAQLVELLSCKQQVAGSSPVNGLVRVRNQALPAILKPLSVSQLEATRLDEDAVLKTVGRQGLGVRVPLLPYCTVVQRQNNRLLTDLSQVRPLPVQPF